MKNINMDFDKFNLPKIGVVFFHNIYKKIIKNENLHNIFYKKIKKNKKNELLKL